MDEIKTKNKFLSEYKKKFETKVEDKDALKAKPITMGKVLEGVVQMPEKVHIAGPIGQTSVRKDKKNENTLHGADGTEFSDR